MEQWIEDLARARQEQQPCALCTLTRVEGSFGRKPGARMLVFEEGYPKGTIGGGSVELEVMERAKQLLGEGKSATLDTSNPETGAKLGFFIESFLPESELVIFGAGHVVRALVYFAKKLGFRITVVDEREGIFSDPVFAGVNTRTMHHLAFLEDFDPAPRHFLVLCSPKHQNDYEILSKVLGKPYAYLGMIGNKIKIEEAKAFLTDQDRYDLKAFEQVDAPIGIKLPGKSPEIIGLSIATKLIMVRNAS
ncbi:MAG: XdhC family protein [Bacteroidales bacterium]|jgi:xanthine dehydrogenase accessory factor|nr:XdhC family protein [Bacteroidales bacterium]NLM91995.1 XdhC family protein [Bacteroidales bacterium]